MNRRAKQVVQNIIERISDVSIGAGELCSLMKNPDDCKWLLDDDENQTIDEERFIKRTVRKMKGSHQCQEQYCTRTTVWRFYGVEWRSVRRNTCFSAFKMSPRSREASCYSLRPGYAEKDDRKSGDLKKQRLVFEG